MLMLIVFGYNGIEPKYPGKFFCKKTFQVKIWSFKVFLS